MNKRFRRLFFVAGLVCALLAACAVLLVADVDDQYSAWFLPTNLGPTVNSAWTDSSPCISKDGLSLYFVSKAPGSRTDFDIYVSQRPSVNDPWGTPQDLGPNVNSLFDDAHPALSLDGHVLYFSSARPEGFGRPPQSQDLYVSRRHNKRDDFGWQPAENMGPTVNSTNNDVAPAVFEDDVTGTITLYFQSNRPGGSGGADIWASTLQADGTFGTPVPVIELNTSADERGPFVRRDGLEMYIASNRPGGLGGIDLWVSTRPSTADPWSAPVNLGPLVNSAQNDTQPALSFDGTELYFESERPGFVVDPAISPHAQDLWVSTRTKLKNTD